MELEVAEEEAPPAPAPPVEEAPAAPVMVELPMVEREVDPPETMVLTTATVEMALPLPLAPAPDA